MQDNYQEKINKAVELHKSKKFAEAKVIYLDLININPIDYLPFFLIGSLEIDLEDYESAIHYLNTSLENNSEYIDTYFNLGFCFTMTNRYEEAIQSYEKAIKLKNFNIKNDEHLRVIRKLARTFVEVGDTEKGIKLYKEILESYPDNLYIYYLLHDLKAIRLDKPLKSRIKKIIKQKKIFYTQVVYSNFLLAKYEREEKNYRNEFVYLKKAHDVIFENNRKQYSKITNFYVNQLSDLKESYLKDYEFKDKIQQRNLIKPIFIVGLPRSGSTLLEKILVEGDENLIAGEETAIMHTLFNQVMLGETYKSNIDNILQSIIIHYERRGLLNFEDKKCFTDKSLENFFCLGWIKKLFPNSVIINIKRDPLASMVSIFRSNLFNSTWTHRVDDICKYIEKYYQILELWEHEYKIPIYHIYYENLIENFDQETKKLFKYAGLKWHKNLKQLNINKKIVSKTQSMIQVREPIYDKVNTEYMELAKFFEKDAENYEWFQKMVKKVN